MYVSADDFDISPGTPGKKGSAGTAASKRKVFAPPRSGEFFKDFLLGAWSAFLTASLSLIKVAFVGMSLVRVDTDWTLDSEAT